MKFLTIVRAEALAGFIRYKRSRAFWILMVLGLAGARFLVPRADGYSLTVSVDQHLPVLSATVIGISIGIALTTLLLPVQFLYLRSSTTRIQPWQVSEVTQASRVAISIGRCCADTAVLLCLLLLLTLAGYLYSLLSLPTGDAHLLRTVWPIWASGVPALTGVAAVRTFFAAFPATRRAAGEVLFLFLWAISLTLPISQEGHYGRLGMHLLDFCGLIQPLRYFGGTVHRIQIGFGMPVQPARLPVDAWSVLHSENYLVSRVAWLLMAVLLTVLAGWAYRPHKGQRQRIEPARQRNLRWSVWNAGSRSVVNARSWTYLPGAVRLTLEQLRFMCHGSVYLLLSLGVAACGPFTNFRHFEAPAFLLLLTFGVTAWAGVSEAAALARLTSLTSTSALQRRCTFLVAGSLWSLLLAFPAAVAHRSWIFLAVGALLGGGVAFLGLTLSILSRTAFAARLVLLLIWYGVISSR